MTLLLIGLFAQADEPKVVYKEKTEIDFEAVDIEGRNKKPRQTLITETNRVIFNSLINLRTEWVHEMEQSVNDIK